MEKKYPFEFSVIMAVYNVEMFLRESLESLIHQDFGFEQIQLILVDDGSKDRSGSICDEYKAKYPRNIIVIHKPNGGVASARNEGLKHAAGRFLNFMDSDDKFTLNAFSAVHQFFCEHENETDIVTIPLQFFDAQQGEHWQNDKFRKGSRVIDLYSDYHAPIMFVNASFFAARTKAFISFDSHLVCGEDIKVLLTILAEKMKLGVVHTCRYLYRRRSCGEDSLIQSSKKKYGWYFDYFTYLVDWAIETYQARFGYLPAFLQYELACDIQWRFREEYDMKEILTDEEIKQYKERLASTLKHFDEKYILEQKMLYAEHKCLMLSYKYGCKPTLTVRDDDAIVHFENTILSFISQQYSMIEFLTIDHQELCLEGYTKVTGIAPDEPLKVYIQYGDESYPGEIYQREEINEYRLEDELLFRGIAFRARIPLNQEKVLSEIKIYLQYKNTLIQKKELRYGRFSPVSRKYAHAYYYAEGWCVKGKKDCIVIEQCDKKKHLEYEKRYLKELWQQNKQGNRKAVLARLLYFLGTAMLGKREIWLISDRPQSAGDNGEAFFQYAVQQSDAHIIPYFVMMKNAPDYQRLRKEGRVVAYLSWKHKILHLLASKIISSQADDIVINPFFNYANQYSDIMQKQQFVFLQHGITANDITCWFNRFRTNMKGFVCAAVPERQSILNDKYYYTEKEVWLTGFPRFDKLYHDEKKQIAIMPTWRASLVDNDKQTGIRKLKKGFESSSYFRTYAQIFSSKRLKKAMEKYGYKLLFVCHPNMMDAMEYFEKIADAVADSTTPYTQIFAESDLVITDYSSIAFDFAYLRKPVVYYQEDKEEFYSGSHTLKKGYFDYEQDGFGEVIYDVEEMISVIIEYMKNGCQLKPRYRERIDSFFAFSDKNNCQRVYDKIMELEGAKRQS